MCCGIGVISVTHLSPARTAITNLYYGNMKAFPNVCGSAGGLLLKEGDDVMAVMIRFSPMARDVSKVG
jgi:hypothetical protein